MKKYLIFLYLILASHCIIMGQKYTYGEVTKELLNLNECPIDKEAGAFVTYKSGFRDFNYSFTQGFLATLYYKEQIKILQNDQKDRGTISIYYYSPKSSPGKSRIFSIKATTYNLEGNTIIKTKLEKENIFETQVNNYYKKVSIVLPNVKKGSVIEYEYQLESVYITNIENWEVQSDIPILYNTFKVAIPEFLKYQINITGSISPTQDASENSLRNINDIERNQSTFQRSTLEVKVRKLVFENVEGFVTEPFTANEDDGKGLISHQLISIQFPNQTPEVVAGDYKKFNDELLKENSFGGIIKKGKFILKLIGEDPNLNDKSKAIKIYDLFKNNIKNNENFGYFSDVSGDDLFKSGSGSIADINLNYIAALNYEGIKTYPVILSKRGYGSVHPIYPDYSSFNYVVALSIIDSVGVFSDPASGLPFGFLPKYCFNGSGFVVDDQVSNWVDLKNESTGKHVSLSELTFDTERIYYKINIQRHNYLAFDDIEMIKEKNDKEFLKDFTENQNGMTLDSSVLTDKNEKTIKLKEYYHIDHFDEDILYVQPFCHLPFDENPFKVDNRVNLVDFPYALDYKYITSIKLSEGFTYEAPQNLNAVMTEKDFILKYHTLFNESTRTLSINAEFKLVKTVYLPEEYVDLKQTMDKFINKLKEPVVLKKIK